MTQYFDFVALGWIEKYLREEMSAALTGLQTYEREPDEVQHLQEALRNVHSATGVLRLCALDPAAILTEEVERVVGQLADGVIAGEARKLAMTEVVAAIEALPAYLANVRAKREVSAGVIANVINDLRHFGNRPSLPDSLFFNPSIKPGAGITAQALPANDEKLKEFASRAVHICFQYSKPALKRDREALKRLYAVGKHATPLLAGTQMEPYFRCYMGLIEALAQRSTTGDEVIASVLKNTFAFLKSMARTGVGAVNEADPTAYIKKMLYYIAKSPAPTALQQSLRDTYEVQNVDEVRIESAGRLIQEDDLLEALGQTLSQLLEVMEFITKEYREICAHNSDLQSTIVPRLRQVSLQLKAIGLETHSTTIADQHESLRVLSEREEPASQGDLLEFGGALIAVKESLEHKLKHGLSAQGDSIDHDLDAAVMEQTARCLNDMKSSINREFTRGELLSFVEELHASVAPTLTQLRPLYRAVTLVADEQLQQAMSNWEQGNWPPREELLDYADKLLAKIPEHSYAEQAALDMEQVLSVLNLMEGKQKESEVLAMCARYIRESISQGGLLNDAGMACFAEAIAALEQYMERRMADPLGNSDEHLDRAEARAQMLVTFAQQRTLVDPQGDNVLDFDAAPTEAVDLEESLLEQDVPPAELAPEPVPVPKPVVESSNVVALQPAVADVPEAASQQGIFWRDALALWESAQIERGADAPLENPDADVDEELVDCLVDESRKYIRRLEDALPTFAADLENENSIAEIRAIFHTMKGSARTIDLMEFGELMFDMEKVFNALRDGYITGTPEIADLTLTVATRMPELIGKMSERVPLYTADFTIVHSIAAAITEKRFDAQTMRLSIADADLPSAATPVAKPSTEMEAVVKTAVQMEDLWSQGAAKELSTALLAKLEAGSDGKGREYEWARLLIKALVPALTELRDGDFLTLDDSTLGYFLDMPVIEQLASNAVFGLVDNGQGEFFKFPLSNEVVKGLQTYLDRLLETDVEPGKVETTYGLIKALIRSALSLPELEPMAVAPVDTISSEQLNQFARGDVKPFEDDGREDPPPSAPGQGVNPDPKPESVRAPEFLLVPESAEEDIEDIDLELLDLFIETLPEYLESIDGGVAQLDKGEAAGLQRLQNTLHTMKGGANSVGIRAFGALIHDFESLLGDLDHAGEIASPESLQQIFPRVDEIQEAADFVRRRREDWDAAAAAEDKIEQESAEPKEFMAVALPGEETGQQEADQAAQQRVNSLRVSTSKIDRLLDVGLEISMSNVRGRRALDASTQGGSDVQNLARRIQDLVDKLSLQLDTEIQAKTETASGDEQFDPLEMDRMTEKQSLAAILREAAFDLEEQAREMSDSMDTAMREAVSLARLIEGSQSEMRLLRLVSFSKLGPGFRRLVHQVSRQLDKQVDFEITCDDGGLDVGVFEQVKTALEHMLRNSIDHGIDTPSERISQGKRETGKISLIIYRQSSEFVIQLLDDGNGLNPDVLRDKAIEHGIINGSDLLSEQEALELIFRSGLSTANEVTEISGRGVGMDVVHQSITQVGGTIEVQSKPGFYTQFDMRIPASIMVNGALLARVGDEEVAIPLTSLDGSDFRHRDDIHRAQTMVDSNIDYRGEEYELRYLGTVRGTLPPPKIDTMPEFVPVLFARLDQRRVAFYADSATNAEDLVIRSLGAQFTNVPGVAGGSLKSDGQPVLALDLNELIRQVDYSDQKIGNEAEEVSATTLILCVDDSVMMRRTYEKRLESLGYEVVTAVDGEDALDYLSEAKRLPDFIFTDLEMPNMNGFDFIANLRRAPLMEAIPTVVVSSRDGDKHRAEAENVGATDFMAKGANSAEGMRAVIERHLDPAALAS
jgi:chemosensory pili system protein ChpA (sensor histidine kinase/response regulator)